MCRPGSLTAKNLLAFSWGREYPVNILLHLLVGTPWQETMTKFGSPAATTISDNGTDQQFEIATNLIDFDFRSQTSAMSQVSARTEYVIPSLVEDKVSPRAKDILQKVYRFVQDECIPAETAFFAQVKPDMKNGRWTSYPAIIEDLKAKARAHNPPLWNLFLHKGYPEGPGLSNLEYALMAEIMGTCYIASEAMNCAAPDTGNMEVFAKYGTPEQKKEWLVPLLDGKIRSAFAMTERFVASSDATNIRTAITTQGDDYVINGRKWWISGAGDPRCKVLLVMGKTDPNNASPHKQQSLVIVPADAPGITYVRPMHVFGEDSAPHGHMEILFENVRVPKRNIILGEGRGFEVIQGRLGPGRIHHCMRTIGIAEVSLDLLINRIFDKDRKVFGKHLFQHGTVQGDVADCRMEIEQARWLVLNAADKIDRAGAKNAMKEIALAKVVVPKMALKVIDRAQQVHGAEGICQDSKLPMLWIHTRTLRYADGPDETHRAQIGRLEMKRAPQVIADIKRNQDRQEAMLKSLNLRAAHSAAVAKL
ncbi:hypothetical protein PROFUN_13046 [Planoprotostelium fungivorum]|uniref:Acyl-CoA dehydrogenase n=1 Tax=Planoprotostelium fungivorum TaxID=1890364 RepID=A0A2P6N5M1_9EUKA|nr:hypothetical protein PROFUN_13046 [Planoprotostelium fungivorum]